MPEPSVEMPSGRRGALEVAAVYGLFAALWILFSDTAVKLIFTDPADIVQASMIKGWLFVAVTSILLFVLVQRLLKRLLAINARQSGLQSERLRALQLVESITENSSDAIFAKDTEGRYILFNGAASKFVGKPASEVLGKDDKALFPPEQAAMLIDAGRKIVDSGHTINCEERLSTPGGERVFLTTKGPLHDATGRIIGLFGIARDISERHKAEEALRDREEKLSAIVNNSPSVLSLKTPDGRYALANPNLQHIQHCSEAEIIGKTDFELYPEAIARILQANDEKVRQTHERHSIEEIIPVDGQARNFMSHIFPVLGEAGDLRFICRISLDITERKKAESALNQLSDDLAATLHAIPDLLFEIDETGRYVKVQASAALLAAPAGELVGQQIDQVLPADAAATVMAALAQASLNETDYGRTISLPLADGTHHFELSVARKAGDTTGTKHFVVISRDITQRKATELALRRNNEELERFNTASIGRELQMIALKKQINELSAQLGQPAPFDLSLFELETG